MPINGINIYVESTTSSNQKYTAVIDATALPSPNDITTRFKCNKPVFKIQLMEKHIQYNL